MGKTSVITTTDHLSGIGSSNIRTNAEYFRITEAFANNERVHVEEIAVCG